jgi:hypothetical protein
MRSQEDILRNSKSDIADLLLVTNIVLMQGQ